MDDLIRIEPNEMVENKEKLGIVELGEELMLDVCNDIQSKDGFSIPIGEIASLGAGISSLIPALRTVTETTTINTQGLYQLVNKGVGDALKVAKNGNYWGAFKTAESGSKFVQLKEAAPISVTNKTIAPINPAAMMMAAALFSVEQKLGDVLEMEKQIFSFLEHEKESEVEADVKTLTEIICKYKLNWDNENFVKNNHKLVLDIKRTADKNIISYQKAVTDILNDKKFFISKAQIKDRLNTVERDFKYYKLSLYIYSLASLLEIMLSGNFKEENIFATKNYIEDRSHEYRELYTMTSKMLGAISKKSIERNVLKGIGEAGELTGKLVGKVPLIKETPIDDLLKKGGESLNATSYSIEKQAVKRFAEMKDPNTGIFIERMGDLIQIFNYTEKMYFDKERVYLVGGK